MNPRITLGCLAAFFLFGCLIPAGALGAAGNVAAYYLLRKPATIRDPAAIEREMDRIEEQVRALRGITGSAPVERTLITPDELRKQMTAQLEKEYPRATAVDDAEVYAAFGVLDPAFDLYAFYVNAYSKYVLGFYDPETKKLYVVSGAGFGASERSTFAHEYMHGLQFQSHGLTADNWASGANSDIGLAKQALVEGEANFVETLWEDKYFSTGARVDYFKQSLAALDLDYFRIPRFLEQMLSYPYSDGGAFVSYLYAKGGWAAVDAAYANPPDSTEQILHPQKYLAGDQPAAVERPALPGTLLGSGEVIRDDALGEFAIDLILSSRLDSGTASAAAAGWGGDRFLTLRNATTGAISVVWHTAWDTQADADEFAAALQGYDGRRFSGGVLASGVACWTAAVTACQAESGSDVWWFYGPDRETVQSLIGANLPASGSI